MINLLKILIQTFLLIPKFSIYVLYDFYKYVYERNKNSFFGWGIHLFVGKFGSSKTSTMVYYAYKLAKKYPQLTILTNIELKNFPCWTNIEFLNSAEQILYAKENTLVLIDEIATIFNSRDFATSKNAVPKILYQHLCQCRHRKIMIYGTCQRFSLLDKQIRDISADVTTCRCFFKHPFSRFCVIKRYDIDEYEKYTANSMYRMRTQSVDAYVQTNHIRNMYDTRELVNNMLNKEYLDDKTILENRAVSSSTVIPYKKKKMRGVF